MNLNASILLQLTHLAVFAAAVCVSWVLTRWMEDLSFRFGYLDYPGGRKQHERPTPVLGGVAIFISFWGVVWTGLWASRAVKALGGYDWIPDVAALTPQILGIFAGSLILCLVGLLDDRYHWSPLRKLAGQLVAALILLGLGLTINLFSGLGDIGYGLTLVWVLLIVNAFNFIDSVDGHCAGVALISATSFFWITQVLNQPMVGLFLVALCGALLGFLPRNFKPARIFLGDNGSLFLGYVMAAITLLAHYQNPAGSPASALVPLLIFGVPIYDTVSVVCVRLRRGQAPWRGDRNHFAHRLVKMGMSDKIAVTFSYLTTLTIGFIAILTTQVHSTLGTALVLLVFLCILSVIAFLEFYAARRQRVIDELIRTHRRRREDIREAEDRMF
ncbi:MAG: putative undecaprenyl-phosphate N-acetylglucosaminyl 1-phosphate transferase [Candidatus Omnitrophica bacterium]|nr:putative undecaprenyl-phosphate N-acetylglucosaminyl 1-phosphate transferase [Candidatus Omnitrophota bacterium]